MTIYIDIVFIENLLLNYIILVATALISKSKIKYLRIFFASCLGSIFSILEYFLQISFIFKILISGFMIYISYNTNKINIFFKKLIMFYLTSLTFGGASYMLLFFINPQKLKIENGHFIGTYPIKVAILGGVLGFTIIAIVSKIIKERMSIKNMLYELEIFYKGKQVRIMTLVDSR